MFEDIHIFKYVCALLCFASIIIPGSIVKIVSLIIAISMLIYKIKRAKESPEYFESLKIDIILIIVVLVVDIGLFAVIISTEHEYNKYNYSSNSSQEVTASDFAETAIAAYQLNNLSQFSDSGNNLVAIKKGFTNYLKNEIGISNVGINGNRITCNIGTDQIIFTVTKNDIKYSIK